MKIKLNEEQMKIKLNEEQINYLLSLPEEGMGYQVVDLILKDGNELKEQIVYNSSILQINEKEYQLISNEDIISLKLS